jgi:type II secretion system protein C
MLTEEMQVTNVKAKPHRPWILMTLGVVAFGMVLAIKLMDGGFTGRQVASEGKVYSAAADAFAPMAASTAQSGRLEPPGVPKPLRLFSIRAGRTSAEGIAVLGAAEASARTYVAGAVLENGATLSELHVDHVVLTRGGGQFKLYLPGQGAGRSSQLASTSSTSLTVGDYPAAEPPLTQPPIQVSDSLRVAPVYDGTVISGFSVRAGAKGGQFDRWGLKAGDVLVTLSGQALYSAEQMEGMLDELAGGGVLRGEVLRDGARVAVTLDGSTLQAAALPPPFPPPPMP